MCPEMVAGAAKCPVKEEKKLDFLDHYAIPDIRTLANENQSQEEQLESVDAKIEPIDEPAPSVREHDQSA